MRDLLVDCVTTQGHIFFFSLNNLRLHKVRSKSISEENKGIKFKELRRKKQHFFFVYIKIHFYLHKYLFCKLKIFK